jgi:hypothetical protein
MTKKTLTIMLLLSSSKAFAWGMMVGGVDVLHVNTFGNYADSFLDGGFCFKLKGNDKYLKIAYGETGEKRKNHDFVQTMVLAAHMAGKELRAQYVDWGTDPSCRVNGTSMPAKWLEDLQLIN